jgi:flagellar biosynthesis protein FlhA
MISVATGIIVTRAASTENFGKDLLSQVLVQPKILGIAGGSLFALSLIPGLPTLPFMFLGAALGYLAYRVSKTLERSEAVALEEERAAELEAAKKPENVLSLLTIDPVELEIGYSLIPLVDPSQGGDLFDRVTLIRRQCALDLGLVIPAIRVRDNMQLRPGGYAIKIKGIEVGHGELMPNHFLAMNAGGATRQVDGVSTTEPAFGLPAIWIDASRREEAEMAGYTVVDPPSVLVTHLTEIVKAHAYALLGRQEVKTLIDGVKETYPAVVEELIPDLLTFGEVQKVLQGLLREGVSIRNLVTILEVLADFARVTKDVDVLIEYVRQALGRQICVSAAGGEGPVYVVTLDPSIEDLITSSVERTDTGSYLSIEPRTAQSIMRGLVKQVERLSSDGHPPVVMCGGAVRPHFKHLIDRVAPKVAVLSFNEVPPEIEVQAVGMVTLDNEG